ncbi:small acid-soluble spore protein P [Paenibacillus montanisoli]|uniref:Small acid-soluble spore protein P n=1 Tax=Paenibacillus montanisoli TaxID=2081970 RepID=A0A328TRW7_9BACL|nr:small acid-soluble spore protein P [Paenibacillus montanisoli]RAP73347.1 small acid-soluble spore protein P [Paenibacillus montanisoli]
MTNGKSHAIPVPNPYENNSSKSRSGGSRQQEPLSGSKKTKQANHVSHNNRAGN